jgi:hypothetical protein
MSGRMTKNKSGAQDNMNERNKTKSRSGELRNRKNAINKGKCKEGIIGTRTTTIARRKPNRKEMNDR